MAKSKSPIDTLSLAEAKILLEVARKVADGQTLDDQLETLVTLVTEATGADRGTLFVNDPSTQELYSRVTVGGLKRRSGFSTPRESREMFFRLERDFWSRTSTKIPVSIKQSMNIQGIGLGRLLVLPSGPFEGS